MNVTIVDLVIMALLLTALYAFITVFLVVGRSLPFSPWYNALVFRHPDSRYKMKGPISGKTVWLYVHRKNSDEAMRQALAILNELKYYAARLRGH
ncbi:hypothetical protein ACQKLP_04285 [Chitinophaga sp. NPDC101104]|uniref:hypothetical protein n=1 Tax=Chitinophaga sp. NPDC101104 TaxID=3390561 RepID=UPI003D00BEEC